METKNLAIGELKKAVYSALQTYSNVHRGSGLFSKTTTHLFEQSRKMVLQHLGLKRNQYEVIFCSPLRATKLKKTFGDGVYRVLSSWEIGLNIGVRALVVKRNAMSQGIPPDTGGGTARLVSSEWVVWAKAHEKFEAGTPAIIHIIAFAKALQLMGKYNIHTFRDLSNEQPIIHDLLYTDHLSPFKGNELLEKLKQEWIGKDMDVPTTAGSQPFVYLDNGASTPALGPVWEAAHPSWFLNNPSQEEAICQVKSIALDFLGAPDGEYDVLFTSNTTEAINLVAESIKNQDFGEAEPVIVNSVLEHNSNELPWRNIAKASVLRLPVDENGFIETGTLEQYLKMYNVDKVQGNKRICLVSLSGASNVLGVYNDLVEIGRIVKKYNACFMVDAAQLVAHRSISMVESQIDYLVFSAHKMYAPFGSGALVARKSTLSFSPAEEAEISLSGEENVAGIVAMGKSMSLLKRIGMKNIMEDEARLTRYALQKMAMVPGLTLFGINDLQSSVIDKRGGVVSFLLKDKMNHKVANRLNSLGGIGVRYGCHCSHILVKRLHNIGPKVEKFQKLIVTLFPKIELPGLVRVSIGLQNTEKDIDHLVEALRAIGQSGPMNGYGKIPLDEVKTKSLQFIEHRELMALHN
jgi:selenocysteine lyase/cysteine desulfurase